MILTILKNLLGLVGMLFFCILLWVGIPFVFVLLAVLLP